MTEAGVVEKGEIVFFREGEGTGLWTVRVMGFPNLTVFDLDLNQAKEYKAELEDFRK